MPFIAAACALFGASALNAPFFLQVALPLAGLCLTGAQAFDPVRFYLEEGSRRSRVAAAFGAMLLCGLAVTGLLLGFSSWPVPPWVLVAVPVAIIAVHLATAASRVDVHVVEWPLRGLAIAVYILADHLPPPGFAGPAYVLVGLYGLGYAMILLAAALIDELRDARSGWADKHA